MNAIPQEETEQRGDQTATGQNQIPTAETAAQENGAPNEKLNPEMLEKIGAIRARIQSTFGQVVLALTAVKRYRHQTVADLTHLVVEPLIRDRVAIASSKPKDESTAPGGLVGIAIWASVSEEVSTKIQEQIIRWSLPHPTET